MTARLAALVLAIWSRLHAHGPDERAIATAIAAAVASETSPASGESGAVDLALLAFYAKKESELDAEAVAYDPLAPGGMSCGPWQMRCPFVWTHSLTDQAREWLRMVRSVGLGDVDSSPTRAAHRLSEARRVLGEAL